ncbi:MAG: helix-turn-helix transcriptional regulator [Clostridia bacterium]|nr:helix-turn-helix transcriptional regulator [Clostridia bacterium]MBR2449249.1 helix-turn-helix transcriptional regulator [Clostridia bacterium]
MSTFGENLKSIRELNKLSQKEFAEKMKTTQQRVSEWECNKVEPSLYNLIRILKIFSVTFEELTEGIEENN